MVLMTVPSTNGGNNTETGWMKEAAKHLSANGAVLVLLVAIMAGFILLLPGRYGDILPNAVYGVIVLVFLFVGCWLMWARGSPK
jgi:hypothetical protein